jgi:uncharacterized protein (TIGR02246 family)
MKHTALLTLAFFIFSVTFVAAQAEDPAVLAAQQSINSFFQHDNLAYAQSFAPQGELVNPMGMHMATPAVIQAMHEPLFNQYWKDLKSYVTFQDTHVRYLEDNLALVAITAEFWQEKDGTEVERTQAQVSVVVKKHQGKWLLELLQVTPIVPMEG